MITPSNGIINHNATFEYDTDLNSDARNWSTWLLPAAVSWTIRDIKTRDGTSPRENPILHSNMNLLMVHQENRDFQPIIGHPMVKTVKDIKNNAWVTMNNDFWVTREAICQWFSLANRLTSDPTIVIRGNECIILFLTRYFMSWKHNSAKNNYRLLISPLSLRTAFSDLVLWRHHSWSVMSHERTALVL